MTFIGKCVVFLMYLGLTCGAAAVLTASIADCAKKAKQEGKKFSFEAHCFAWIVFACLYFLFHFCDIKEPANTFACSAGLTTGIVLGIFADNILS